MRETNEGLYLAKSPTMIVVLSMFDCDCTDYCNMLIILDQYARKEPSQVINWALIFQVAIFIAFARNLKY